MQLPLLLENPPHWSALSQAERRISWRAATHLVRSMQELAGKGLQIVQAIIEDRPVIEWDHYPDDDVRDARNASQYFYHAHGGLQRPFEEHGHFHLFVHAEEIGLRRPHSKYASSPAHLLAVSMDAQGLPAGFFFVNRWVTKGPWLSAKECTFGLQHFQVKGRHGRREINVFLRSLLSLYQQQIAALLLQREQVLQHLCSERDRRSVFADREVEVLCYLPIKLMDDIAELENLM